MTSCIIMIEHSKTQHCLQGRRKYKTQSAGIRVFSQHNWVRSAASGAQKCCKYLAMTTKSNKQAKASPNVVLPEALGMDTLLAFLTAGVGLGVAEGAPGPLVLVDDPVPDHIEAALRLQPPAAPAL